MRISTRGLLAALLGVALALAVGLVPGMAKTARADATPTYTITATDGSATATLSEGATLPRDATIQSILESLEYSVTSITGAETVSGDNVILSGQSITVAGAGTSVIKVNMDSSYAQITITAAQEYPLWVGGAHVTEENKGNVLKGTANDGKVSFSPAEAGAPATLTLDGASITTGHVFNDVENVSHSYGIYYTGTDPLTIAVVSDSTVDVSSEEADVVAGIFCEYSGLTITGEGKLTATGVAEGISGYRDVTIDKGVVDATGENSGIIAREGNVDIINGSTVVVNGGINGKRVTIDSGTVKASGVWSGIFGDSVTIRGGEVTATASNGNGISAHSTNDGPGTVTISGGIVSATGGAEGCGIYTQECSNPQAPGSVTVDSGIASVTASGGKQAIEGTITNAVAGMGWTDAAGTTGKAAIAINAEGQDLGAYKKVQFPAPVAKVTTTPGATNPTYDGKAQALVTAGAAEGGTMRYSLDGATWSNKVPTGTDAKSYTVWYKAVGDDQHADSEPQKVTSTIMRAEPTPTVTVAEASKPTTEAYPSRRRVAVSWKAAKGAKTYQLQWRKAGAKKWTTASVGGRKRTVTGLKKGVAYEFRVRGVNGKVSGKWSKASPCWLKGVSKVKAAPGKSKGSVKVSWKADKAATGGFKVFVYAKKGGKLVTTKKAKPGATSATVKGLKSGKKYYVRVSPYLKKSGTTYPGAVSGWKTAKAK